MQRLLNCTVLIRSIIDCKNYSRTLLFSSTLYSATFLALLYFSTIVFINNNIIHLMKWFIESFFSGNKHFPGPLPPGPLPWPVVGCIPEMWRNRPAHRWIHRLMRELNTDIACIRLGNCHVIVVTSSEIAREFLKKHDAVFASRPVTMATRILSHGFITTVVVPWGEQWRKMRRVLVSEILNQSRVRWLLDKRNEEADNLVRFLYNQCSKSSKGEVVNVRTAVQHYSAGVMRRMIFNKRYFGKGREDGGPGCEEEEHVSALLTMLLHVYSFCLSDYLPWLTCLDLDGHKKMVSNAMEIINKYQNPIVDDRFRQWREGKRTEPEDLLDVFISLKDSDGNPLLSDEEVRAQVTELLLATLVNPSTIAEWALAELLNKPEMLRKAVEELDTVVGKHTLLQESHTPHLPYLLACARESLRLHPIAPFNLPHVSTADCTVANGRYFIPKGSVVLLSRLGLGRNPAVWEDPLLFNPDRHMEDHHADLAESELRFITFSTGRRGCVALELGTKITMMLLGRLLQGFTWNVPQGLDKIDTSEDVSHSKATPLFAHAKPRLNPSVYLSLV